MAVRQYVNKGSRCRRSAAHNTHRNFLDSQAMVEHNWNMKNIEQVYWKRWVRWLTTAPKKVNECEQKLSWGKAEMPLTPARQTQGDHNKTVRSHLCSNQMEVDLRIRPVQTGETERANQKADVIATHFYNDLSIACPSTCGAPPKYIWCPMNFKWWQWLQRRKNFKRRQNVDGDGWTSLIQQIPSKQRSLTASRLCFCYKWKYEVANVQRGTFFRCLLRRNDWFLVFSIRQAVAAKSDFASKQSVAQCSCLSTAFPATSSQCWQFTATLAKSKNIGFYLWASGRNEQRRGHCSRTGSMDT